MIHLSPKYPDPDKWRRFLRSPLWLALPAVVAVIFGVVYLLLYSAPEVTPHQMLKEGLFFGAFAALTWGFGIWQAENGKPKQQPNSHRPVRWWQTSLWILAGIVCLLIAGWCFYDEVIVEGKSIQEALVGYVVTFLTVLMAVIPRLWLQRK